MPRGRPLPALTIPAALLAAGMVFLAVLTARILVEREEAVRDGLLLGLGHELESGLREGGPDKAEENTRLFVARNAAIIAGAELFVRGDRLAAAGTVTGEAIEMPAFLGREWRSLMMGGGGMGGGGAHGSPAKIRLYPNPSAGKARSLAAGVVATALTAGVGLVVLAFVAARNLVNRQRLESAEAEHRRLESVALAGAGLAHKIRNPLAVIKGTSQMLEAQLEEPARGRARRIVESSERIEGLITRLLDFARPPERHVESFDLVEVAKETLGRQPGKVKLTFEAACPVSADRENVVSILEELLANARAFDLEGEIHVVLRTNDRGSDLVVSDRGPGLQLESGQLFQPYVTTRPEGTGLGLAIVKSLADVNGLTVSLRNREGGGCSATVTFPARRG